MTEDNVAGPDLAATPQAHAAYRREPSHGVHLDGWARGLSDARLAQDLDRIADNPRVVSPMQRVALLREAARRLR